MHIRLKPLLVTLAVGLPIVALGCSDSTGVENQVDTPPVFGFGNGAPSGPHYNLNIIGVPKSKTASMTSGGRIFVPLGSNGNPSKTKIKLCESGVGAACADLDPTTFVVLDANGTDGEASFALPDPDPDADGTSVYSVYVRPLGIPGGHADNQTCGLVPSLDEFGDPVYDPTTGEQVYEEICSVVQLSLDRTKGKQSFIDATACLLYIYADLDFDGTLDRAPIFGDPLVDSWWEWSNEGLKLAQLRFYPVPSDVPAPDAVVDCTSKGKFNG
jgi:hypothetical protein